MPHTSGSSSQQVGTSGDPKVAAGSQLTNTAADTNPPTDPEEALYVPVTNMNFIAQGVQTLQGYVPNHPVTDPTLSRIKDGLITQGEEAGPDVTPPDETFDPENPYRPDDGVDETDPTPPDPEAPIDQREPSPEELPERDEKGDVLQDRIDDKDTANPAGGSPSDRVDSTTREDAKEDQAKPAAW